jgi:hypothetical protein
MSMTGLTEVPDVFDDPVLQVALCEVWLSADVGYRSGYEDGLAGAEMRPAPNCLPQLFVETYITGYRRGTAERLAKEKEERESKLNDQEIALLFEQRGLCHGADKNEHSDPEGKSGISMVEKQSISPTPNDKEGNQSIMNTVSTPVQGNQDQKPGFWQKLRQNSRREHGSCRMCCSRRLCSGKKSGHEGAT